MRQNDGFPVQDASVNANAIVNVDFLIIVQVLSLTFPHGQAQFFSAAAHIGNRAKLTRENHPNKYNIDINQPKSLHNHLVLLVQRPEITRSDSAFGLEDTVEVGQIVETAFVTDFRDILGRIHQHPRSIAEPDVQNIVRQRLAGAHPEETAESGRAHAHH